MFGNKKVQKKKVEEPESPDLVVGMPGFTSAQDKTEAGIPGFGSIGSPLPQTPVAQEQTTVAKAVAAPVPEFPVPEEPTCQYQVLGAELVQDGLYRYTIVTNKNIGEVGGVYEM